MGVQDLVLDVIMIWKHKTLAHEFYDEYFVPRYTTDIVLTQPQERDTEAVQNRW